MITEVKELVIPNILIYEQLDGLNIYYSNYQSVLENLENVESVMGSSGLQSFIIEMVKDFLKINLANNYRFLSNEVGLHISKNNNLSADTAIFSKTALPLSELVDKYLNIAPKVVIEIDTKADFSNMSAGDYFNIKTQKLLDFGVEQVVWIYTQSKKIMSATNDAPWQTMDWNKNVEVLGETLNVVQLLKKEGYKL